MNNWVYPLSSASGNQWEVSQGTADSSITIYSWSHTGAEGCHPGPGCRR